VGFWNATFRTRRGFYPISEALFRQRIVAQQAFDPAGLILAMVDGEIVGLVHAIKPAPPDVFVYRRRRCRDNGSIAVLAVASDWRGRGIGSALLSRAESYLQCHLDLGKLIHAGDYDVPLYHTLEGPRQPFWGDTEILGIAEGDRELVRFLTRRGYSLLEKDGREITMVANLGACQEPVAPALEELGLREVCVSDSVPWPGQIGWYPQGEFEGYAHGLCGEYRHDVLALARGDSISSHVEWYPMQQTGHVALWDYQVAETDRGRGLGSYLLDKSLWAMMRQGYHTVELHTHTIKNALAYGMYLRRGFEVVESWLCLQKPVRSGKEVRKV
jgi:ribosomal protein S18 acetylase RimI-like enzyme